MKFNLFLVWYKLRMFVDGIAFAVAWMLPAAIVKYAFLRVINYAATGQYKNTPPALLEWHKALNRWNCDTSPTLRSWMEDERKQEMNERGT